METTRPTPFIEQISGKDAEGMPVLSVLFKQTWTFDDRGSCTPASKPQPLVRQLDIENPGWIIKDDSDLYPFKTLTDVVVKGHVHAPNGASRLPARVVVGSAQKTLLAVGPRKATLGAGGRIVFSEPKVFNHIPLSYRYAYGGRDVVAEKKYGNIVREVMEKAVDPTEVDLNESSPFSYPRNLAGRGYLMEPSREALEAIRLPNLEDPEDPVSPERLAVDRPALWPRMPVPQGTGWFSWAWFPRCAYAGLVRQAEPVTGPIAEERRGWCLPGLLGPFRPELPRVVRSVQGASLGLSVPLLRGGETILLENLHPRAARLAIQLPSRRPVLMTDGRKGKLNPTEPVIHNVVLCPDENTLTVLWRGSARALRPYFNQELATMPFLARSTD